LPRLTGQYFDLALDIHPDDRADLALLNENGWNVHEPQHVASNPWVYRDFIQQSGAELSIAKGIVVETQCGWFSDRSICYLASGKPVIVQDTGIKNLYPTGEGLLTFSTLDEAVAAVESVASNYQRHARAAREIAEEYFDSDKVLLQLLAKLGIDAP
jgi:glycosyltransferase involved in cell wall biosynthesis